MTDHPGGPALTVTDFAALVRAVHRYEPFPWQTALVAQVLADGRWPDLIDVPTGLGKTTMIDVSVFVAAATVGRAGAGRVGRRRCFFVVDRRLVVDEAWEHARRLSQQLAAAQASGQQDVLGRVAAGLHAYAPDAGGDLLPVTRMRGGTTWSSAWLDRPDRPSIVLGTVDQVGSRLLFRGYGVSDRRKPIDAALVGTDALLLVDEAHLSDALLDTVEAVQQRDRLEVPLPGLTMIRLSATYADAARPFVLDREAHRGDPEAWRRLTAAKRLTLTHATGKDCVRVIADAALEQMSGLAQRTGDGVVPAVLVVCNTVNRARAVHDHLARHFRKAKTLADVDCDLLIGRSRPIDKPEPGAGALGTLDVRRPTGKRPAVLVATQTVEVGVNIDGDALVTESASWEALVQRLGRLNRLGRFGQRYPDAQPAAAIVVHDGQQDGLIYGTARDATWTALTDLVAAVGDGGLDVSPLACRELNDGPLGSPATRRAPVDVPVLLRPILDAWVQTAPIPLIDPPVAPYLHGFDTGTAAVQVLWREGLVSTQPLDDPFDDGDTELESDLYVAILGQFPPRSDETVEIPFHAVRQWMLGQSTDAVGDLETEPEPVKSRPTGVRDPFRVLAQRPVTRARGTGRADSDADWQWVWITAEQLRPADQIIVPVQRGGLDRYGWAPRDNTPVVDASEPATFLPRRRAHLATLRLDGALADRLGLADDARTTLRQLLDSLQAPGGQTAAGSVRNGGQDLQQLGADLADLLPRMPPPGTGWPGQAWENMREWWASGRLSIVEILDRADPIAGDQPTVVARLLSGPVAADDVSLPPQPERDDDEAAASSVGPNQVTLDQHHTAVRERCRRIARALGLPDELRRVLEDAAGWHDLGKVEERFQVMLHGGDALLALTAVEPLAKSGLDPADHQAWRRAARLSRLPGGARHEAWSAALIAAHLQEHPHPGDADLLLHLVAAHHGYARPLARLIVDPDPRPVETVIDGHKSTTASERTVDLDQPARFTRLNARYGRWGLALLETVVRCADMTVSEEGS